MSNSARLRRARLLTATIAAVFISAMSQAQTYTVQSITAPNFGTVAAATAGTTTFRNNGSASVVSGSGEPVSSSVTRGSVTIRCANGSGAPTTVRSRD